MRNHVFKCEDRAIDLRLGGVERDKTFHQLWLGSALDAIIAAEGTTTAQVCGFVVDVLCHVPNIQAGWYPQDKEQRDFSTRQVKSEPHGSMIVTR